MAISAMVGSAQDQKSAPAIVEGIVTIAGTGEPVQDARIVFSAEVPAPQHSAMTNTDGRFVLKDLPQGRYTAAVSKTGLVQPRRDGPVTIAAARGEHIEDIHLYLRPSASITGFVYAENGRVKSGVRIAVMQSAYRNGRRGLMEVTQSWAHADTDNRGQYRLSNLEPGEYYYLRATAPWSGSVFTTIYYPGVTDPNDATPLVSPQEGELRGPDFRLRANPFSSILLKVVLKPEDPAIKDSDLFGTFFYLVRRGQTLLDFAARTRFDYLGGGRFKSAGLPPGIYDVDVYYPAPNRYGHAVAEVSGIDTDIGTIEVGTGKRIEGRVVSTDALSAVQWKRMRIALRPVDGRPRFSLPGTGLLEDGTFVLEGAHAGQFQVTLAGMPEGFFLESATYGGMTVEEGGFAVASTDVSQLQLTIAGKSAIANGVVQDGNGKVVANARVVLLPAAALRGNPNLVKTAVSDQFGRFSIQGIAPGDYVALAWEHIESGAWESPEVMTRFEDLAVKFAAGSGSRIDLKLQVIP